MKNNKYYQDTIKGIKRNMKNINDNVIANRWKQRYAQQPDRIKEKLKGLSPVNYRLQSSN